MRFDRRIPFFVIAAIVCFLLVPLADHGLRYIPKLTGIVYLVLALVFLLDWLGRRTPG